MDSIDMDIDLECSPHINAMNGNEDDLIYQTPTRQTTWDDLIKSTRILKFSNQLGPEKRTAVELEIDEETHAKVLMSSMNSVDQAILREAAKKCLP
jgi:hypothetical protein